MIKMIFEYEVPAENQDAYLQETKDKVKPLWESKGCKTYHVWQESENPNRFVKEMYFDDAAQMKETMALKDLDPVKEIFYGYAVNVTRKLCELKTGS